MRKMLAGLSAGLALALLALAPTASQASIRDFVGNWENTDSNTGDITRLEIRRRGARVTVHVFGACSPEDCDNGQHNAVVYAPRANSDRMQDASALTVQYNTGFSRNILVLRAARGLLAYQKFTNFTDRSARTDYENTGRMRRVRGGGGGQPPARRRPDLVVRDIRLIDDCRIQVTLANAGTGRLPDSAYHRTNGATVQMTRNGQSWGGLRLAGADPQRRLRDPGATVRHIWFPNAANLRLGPGPHRLSVTVDGNNAVAESNEDNNTRTERVRCRPGGGGGGALQEDCVSFDPSNARVARVQGRWKIVDGDHWVFDFGSKRAEARRSLQIIRNYNFNQACYVGRPNASMTYLKRGNSVPRRNMSGDDCIRHDAANYEIRRDGSRWLLTDGRSRIKVFPSQAEAREALRIIQRYRLGQLCYVGRPNASLEYWLRR